MSDAGLARQLDDLAAAHRFLAAEGHEDRTSGHVSWRDPSGRGFWMKRAHIGMDEALHASDMILVGWDGATVAGTGARHRECRSIPKS
jgi:L-fuculose-phosphate aldolase